MSAHGLTWEHFWEMNALPEMTPAMRQSLLESQHNSISWAVGLLSHSTPHTMPISSVGAPLVPRVLNQQEAERPWGLWALLSLSCRLVDSLFPTPSSPLLPFSMAAIHPPKTCSSLLPYPGSHDANDAQARRVRRGGIKPTLLSALAHLRQMLARVEAWLSWSSFLPAPLSLDRIA